MPLTTSGPMEPLSMNRLASSQVLAGTSLILELEGGGRVQVHFGAQTVQWTASDVDWAGSGEDPCDVVEVRPGVCFIDIDFQEFTRALEALTIVTDATTGWALVIHQERFHPEQTWSRGPEVRHVVSAARIDGAVQRGPAPAVTRDLIGQRHLHRYSTHNVYEHIYLSSTTMCGHNVRTIGTPGRADCHPLQMYRMALQLYVVAWREYDSAAAMIALLDLDALQITGKVLDPEHFLRSANRAFGGPIIPVGHAPAYPVGLEPR